VLRRPFLVVNLALLLAVGLFVVGFAIGRGTAPEGPAAKAPSTKASDDISDYWAAKEASDDETPEVETPALELGPDDFALEVKIVEKQCFGSAGCNIEYKVEPTYKGQVADLEDETIDITFKVLGDDSGAQTGTITLDGGSYDLMTRSASTSGDAVKLKAKVTEVTVY